MTRCKTARNSKEYRAFCNEVEDAVAGRWAVNGEYERIILGLERWFWGVLRKEKWDKGPGADSLKPLGNEAETDGEAEDVAADARVKVMEKALSVARDIESGRLRPPTKPEQYFKEVMRHALKDWKRTQLEAVNLSSDERAWLDNELSSIDEDEGDEDSSVLPTVRVPVPSAHPRSPAWPQRPPLLTLVRQRFWRRPAVSAEYERVQQLVDDIPDDRRREAVLLDLQGHRQEQIANRLLVSQPYVSRVLKEQHDAWGWDDGQVQRIRYVTTYANLVRLFGRVFPDEGFVFPRPRRQRFWWESRDFKEEERQSALRMKKERYDTSDRAFELPREDEAYRRSRQPGTFLDEEEQDLEEEERDRNEWRKPGPRQGSKERRQRQDRLNRLKAEDAKLYRAIMNDPALARRTKNLKLYHMPQLIALMVRDHYEYDYEANEELEMGLRP
jgi:DNA-directed RNA polymerase specialized sigma24 family protein